MKIGSKFRPEFVAASFLMTAYASAGVPVDVSPIVTDQTVLVVQADLEQIRLPLVADWAADTLKRNGLPENDLVAFGHMTNAAPFGQRYIEAFRDAGVERIAAVVALDAGKHALHFAIALPRPENRTAVLQAAGPLDDTEVGNLLLLTLPGDAGYFDSVKAAPRDDLLKPLAAHPDAALTMALAMSDAVRETSDAKIAADSPKAAWSQLVLGIVNLRTADVTIDVHETPHLIANVDYLKAEDAQKIRPSTVAEKAMPVQGRETDAIRQLVAELGAKVNGTKVSVDAKQADFDRFATAAIPVFKQARDSARRVASASNIRQLLMGAIVYVNDHKDALPPDLATAIKGFGVPAKVLLTNPYHPELGDKGFIYVAPPVLEMKKISTPSTRLAIYEAGDFGTGINVGFWDGHVELVTSKVRFDKLLAEAKDPPAK